ncbi:hypothetical protein FXB40_00685 [Bradyrhizobium rifense]|uniref:Uncharacterized protein n=1 Tax=Bradyrhizobium rifense TaxID=515499 RepID=A0A5D3KPL2_9BRAD|nr:hypothetical protein FXB40_00685 [Bradyrhizobium rifense]
MPPGHQRQRRATPVRPRARPRATISCQQQSAQAERRTRRSLSLRRVDRACGEIFVGRCADGALPLPLAGEGWGEGVSTIKSPQEERTLTRRYAPTSPARGRGAPSPRQQGSRRPTLRHRRRIP